MPDLFPINSRAVVILAFINNNFCKSRSFYQVLPRKISERDIYILHFPNISNLILPQTIQRHVVSDYLGVLNFDRKE